MSEQDRSVVTKLAKLKGANKYINWKRRIKAYIQRTDTKLVGLSDCPKNENQHKKKQWRNAMVKAKLRSL